LQISFLSPLSVSFPLARLACTFLQNNSNFKRRVFSILLLCSSRCHYCG
jgi:hypothetical protein